MPYCGRHEILEWEGLLPAKEDIRISAMAIRTYEKLQCFSSTQIVDHAAS